MVLCLAMVGCSAQPRIYSRVPVDQDGGRIPLESAKKIVFEDGTSYELSESESLSIRKDSLRASGSDFGTAVWSLGQVEGIEWRDASGSLHWTDVRTPEDLRAFVKLPRIESIELADGSSFSLDDDRDNTRLDPTGLFILLSHDEDWENATRIELAQVEQVRLHEPNLAGATVRSPMFWLATAAAGVAIYLVTGDGDPARTAVR